LLYLKYIGIAGLKEWIIGSSIIKKALIEARKRPGGIQLVLTRLCMSLWWQGRSEMSLDLTKKTFLPVSQHSRLSDQSRGFSQNENPHH
jgi:hypothetical protein